MRRQFNPLAIARRRRWMATGRSRVSHPEYGSVIVPHGSKLSALENAAELWGIEWSQISGGATVTRVEKNEGPTVLPRNFVNKERP